MHRLYQNIVIDQIKKAAGESNWGKVTALYFPKIALASLNNAPDKSTLDNAIVEAVQKRIYFCDLSSELSKENVFSYLLRALTLAPSATTKLSIYALLKSTATFEDVVESGEIGKLLEKSTDIFTVIQANHVSYEEALSHVEAGKAIPSLLALQTALATKPGQ